MPRGAKLSLSEHGAKEVPIQNLQERARNREKKFRDGDDDTGRSRRISGKPRSARNAQ